MLTYKKKEKEKSILTCFNIIQQMTKAKIVIKKKQVSTWTQVNGCRARPSKKKEIATIIITTVINGTLSCP